MSDSTRDDTSESLGHSSMSAGLYRALFEDAADGLFVADADGRYVAVNRRAAELTGYGREDLVGMALADLIAPETLAETPTLLDNPTSSLPYFLTSSLPHFLTSQGGSLMIEGAIRRKDGRVLAVEIGARSLPDGQRLEIVRDISERKREVEALRESEEKYRSLIESARDPIFTSDADGRYLFVNTAAAAGLGSTPEKMVGKTVDDLFPPHIAEKYRAGVRHVIETGEDSVSEDLTEVNGRRVWVSSILQPVRDRDGRVTAAQGIVRDITSLKQAEQALRESEERLRQAVRVADIGIFDHDHTTDTLYWSAQQREIFGVGPDEPLWRKDPGPFDDNQTARLGLDYIHAEDRARIEAAIRHAHEPAGGGAYDIEHRIVRRDGSVRWVTVRSQTLFDGEGGARHPVRTVGAVRDITETKQAEEEHERLRADLIQAQKMESVGRLAGGVAHDFNNMLNVIGGYAELALAQLDPAEPLAADIQEIQKAARRSADLTRQLLAFARKQIIAPKLLRFNDVITGSLAMLRRLIGEDIDLIFRPGDDLWPVRIDPTQLDQVLANLSANARDAIAGVGQVAIRTENVVLDDVYCARHAGSVAGQYVRLEVTDNGCGMDQATLLHIFEPFYTTKAEGQGTGLGLATVYGIATQNQGYVSVRSEEGRGTTVEILLPRFAGETAKAVTEERPDAPAKGTETILLVEDEAIVLQYGKTLLERLGYSVLAANTPREAIRLAEEHIGKIQLLVTDVVMPEMNGPDLAERLAARDPRLKVLFVSGYFTGDSAPRGVKGTEVHFLQKPFSKGGLAAKVREVLDGK